MGDLAQEMWDMAQHNFEACCRLDKRLGNNYSAYRYAEQRIAELEFKVKLGDQFKERAHYVAKATQEAWEETVDELNTRIAELEAESERLREANKTVDTLFLESDAENERLQAALRIYADPDTWGNDGWGVKAVNTREYKDAGAAARQAILGDQNE